MAFLNLESLLSLSEVNKEFYLLAQDPQLWQRLFKGRFSRGKEECWHMYGFCLDLFFPSQYMISQV